MNIKTFSQDLIDSLIAKAAKSRRLRQHWNIHESYKDPCQRFFNAIEMDSYIRPHRHSLDPKSECLIAIRGLFALLTFIDDGAISGVVRFGTEKYQEADNLCVGVEVPSGLWHTVIALEPSSVLLELKAGPFSPNAAKEYAYWAPEEGSPEATTFFHDLRKSALETR